MSSFTESSFDIICRLENLGHHQRFASDAVNLWPLIRRCIWTCLVQKPHRKPFRDRTPSIIHFISDFFCKTFRLFYNYKRSAPLVGSETVAFFSRPVYLQHTPFNVFIDRIVDPLLCCIPTGINAVKYYVSSWPIGAKLKYKGSLIKCPQSFTHPSLLPEHINALVEISEIINIPSNMLIKHCLDALQIYQCWFAFGHKFFESRPSLKTIFVTGWYSPVMMGLISAAHLHGIYSVDIQHGKQGKFQPMYSGWIIPEDGYELMPDCFWCWGKQSFDHILESSPNRVNHRPLIGGYPWIQYYERFLKPESPTSYENFHVRVLFTLQPPTKDNTQPIPDFVVDYLCSSPSNVFFVFRVHPNHVNSVQYCERRLSLCPRSLYAIDDGSTSLYDLMLSSTHHITAFSSCCYEASEFGVPSLLYGDTSLNLYSNEIADDIFSWSSGNVNFLAQWLATASIKVRPTGYINSSMASASEVLSSIVV